MQHDIRAVTRTTLIATSLVAMFTIGCQDNQAGRKDQGNRPDQKDNAPVADKTQPAGTKPDTVKVDELRESPSRFYGKQVQVSGKVESILTDRAFELEGAGWAFKDNISVFTKTPILMGSTALAKGDEVIVNGVVHPFVVADVERELGWDLTPETEIRLKERPVLIADSIRKVSESGRWSSAGTSPPPIATVVALITTGDVSALVGQQVELNRERVHAVTSKGLWVGPSTMSQVFVLPTTPPTAFKPGDTVQVSGTLRKVPANPAQAWDLPPALAGAVREGMIYVDNATVRPAAGATAQTTPD